MRAAIVFAVFLTFMQISSPPWAANASRDPADFDILGMKLGMTVEEIQAAIKTYDPALPISNFRVPIRDRRLSGSVQFVKAGNPPQAGREWPPESITVAFTVTEPARAFSISREKRFSPDQQPLKDKTVQQLQEKYGAESKTLGLALDWAFDREKKPVAPSVPLYQTCAHVSRPNLYTYLDYYGVSTGPGFYAPECSVALHVGLMGVTTNPQLLSGMNELLVSDSIAVDDIQKLMAAAKAEQDRQRQLEEQKASKTKAPL